MVGLGYKLDEVLNLGYYEAYRLWTIYDETSAKNLQNLAIIIDHPHSSSEKREEVWNWLKSRQQRSAPKTSEIPQEVLEKFKEHFNRG